MKVGNVSMLLCAMVGSLVVHGFAIGQTPVGTAFTYQGKIQRGGSPVNDVYDFKFDLYDAPSGGTQLGSLSLGSVAITDGLFTVDLDYGSGVFSGDARWLAIAVRRTGTGNYFALPPLQELTPAPYALYALDALFATDADKVDNYDAGNGSGQVAVSNGILCGNLNAQMLNGLTYDGLPYSSDGHDHASEVWAASGVVTMLTVHSTHQDGLGLLGQGCFTGIRGETVPSCSPQVGVCIGVSGIANTPACTNYGVYGAASGSGGAGIYGLAVSPESYAGYFNGDVEVTGTLTKPAGSFKIDHPLDPANKYLQHSFVESPDMMNIYNGNTVTDGEGRAEVVMPEWFAALNMDFRYQLTVIGQFAQAIVDQEIQGIRFAIKTDKPNVKVSWQVTGIRKDAFAKAHRISVEQEKPSSERGKYLHPELYGQPRESAVGYIERSTASAQR